MKRVIFTLLILFAFSANAQEKSINKSEQEAKLVTVQEQIVRLEEKIQKIETRIEGVDPSHISQEVYDELNLTKQKLDRLKRVEYSIVEYLKADEKK